MTKKQLSEYGRIREAYVGVIIDSKWFVPLAGYDHNNRRVYDTMHKQWIA
jgi:hypothetical protein